MFDQFVTSFYFCFHEYKVSAILSKMGVQKCPLYCVFSAYRTKIKCAKMRCYYKEVHEREQQAKTRNLELLGNVESLTGKLKEFSIDCSRLLQKRVTTLGSCICPNIRHMCPPK